MKAIPFPRPISPFFLLAILFPLLLVSGCASSRTPTAPTAQALQPVSVAPSPSARALPATVNTSPTPQTPAISSGEQRTPADSLSTDEATEHAVVKSVRVNIREHPSKSGAVVEEISQGETLRLLSKSPVGPWYKVRHDETGAEGWIHGNGIVIKDATAEAAISEPQPLGTEEAPEPVTNTAPKAKAGGATSGRSYRNVDGELVRSPVFSNSAPEGATARCRDGSYSFSRNRRGTCSHHGGVAQWL